MTKMEWLTFLASKGESLLGKQCVVPAEYIGSMWLYRNRPWTTGTIVKLTKGTMVGVLVGKNIQSYPYDLVELTEEK